MNFTSFLDPSLSIRLLLALGHFLWQGLAVALVAGAVITVLRRASAQARYGVLVVALAAMFVCPLVTFCLVTVPTPLQPLPVEQVVTAIAFNDVPSSVPLHRVLPEMIQPPQGAAETTSSDPQPDGVLGATSPSAPSKRAFDWQRFAPAAVAAYLAGVIGLLGRLVLGLHGGRRLCRRSEPVEDRMILEKLTRQVRSLGLCFTPAVAWCRQVAVPVVVGVLRPTILLPLSLATGLAPDQVAAILTHELAHIRRYDHLVNLAQRLIEAFLFFHPTVWWLSRRIRIEREHCCDDLVVSLGATPVHYSESLLRVAELSQLQPSFEPVPGIVGLYATTRPSRLRQRIARLLGGSVESQVRLGSGWMFVLAVSAAVALAVPSLLHLQADVPSNQTAEDNASAEIVKIDATDAGSPARLQPNDRQQVEPITDSEGDTQQHTTKRDQRPDDPQTITLRFPEGVYLYAHTEYERVPMTLGFLPRTKANEISWSADAPVALGVMNQVGRSQGLGMILDLSPLDTLARDTLHSLFITKCLPRPEDMRHIARLSGLKRLNLNDVLVNDAMLQPLEALPNLEVLLISGDASNEELPSIGNLQNLRELSVRSIRFSDAGLKHMESLSKLESISIYDGNRMTETGCRSLGAIRSLKRISIQNAKLTADGLAALAALPQLEWLEVPAADWDSLRGLRANRTLRELYFRTTDPGTSPPTLDWLAGLQSLETLGLPRVKIPDDEFRHLRGLTRLKSLDYYGTREGGLSDGALAHLAGLKLETIRTVLQVSPQRYQVTDSGLKQLAGMTSLRTLEIGGQITAAGLKHLHGLNNLERLIVVSSEATKAGEQELLDALPNVNRSVGDQPRGFLNRDWNRPVGKPIPTDTRRVPGVESSSPQPDSGANSNAAGGSQTRPQPPDGPPDRLLTERSLEFAWGEEKDGLRTRLVLLTEKPSVGKPLNVRVELQNVGAVERKYAPIPSLRVRMPDSRPVPYYGAQPSLGTPKVIGLGETVVLFDEFDLAQHFLLTQPRRYTIQFDGGRAYLRPGQGRDVTDMPPSETIEVELGPGPVPPLRELYLSNRPPQHREESPSLDALTELPTLKRLRLPRAPLSDDEFRHLAKLPELRWLEVQATYQWGLTDGALAHLASLRLEKLHAAGAITFGPDRLSVSDEGLKHLSKMKTLRELHIGGPITDQGLEHLYQLNDLEQLLIVSNEVTPEAERVLRAQLPGLSDTRIVYWTESWRFASPPDPASEGWGPLLAGLSTRLVVQGEEHAVGQPLKFRLEMKNFGTGERHYDPQTAEPFRRLYIIRADGEGEPYIGPTYQTAGELKAINPGETVVLWDDFDAAGHYLFAEPGKYVVLMTQPARPLAGVPALTSIPPSKPVTVELAPGKLPDLNAMFVRMREILPKEKAWRISMSGGVIFFTHSPTNLKKDVTTIQLWFDEKEHPPGYSLGDGANKVPVEPLGKTKLGFAYMTAPARAADLWPEFRKKILAELNVERSAKDTTDDRSVVYRSRRGVGRLRQPDETVQRADRWEIAFPAGLSETDYAQFLDHAKIRLAVEGSERWSLVSQVSTPEPTVESRAGFDERQLNFEWAGGAMRQVDLSLVRKAGVAVTGNETIVLVLPFEAEQLLARLEREYLKHAKNHTDMRVVRRTRFVVRKISDSYEFNIESQQYFGEPKAKDDINRPWLATGRVTDADGRPMAGVEVMAHCGMGTLFMTGSTETDTEGSYKLLFEGAIPRFNKNPVTLQAATISVHKPGFFERNLHRQGDRLAAYSLDGVEFPEWGKKNKDAVFLPGEPKEINFVMLPAAKASGTLVNKHGKALAGYRMSLTGADLPPSSSALASGGKTDENGRFEFRDIPTGYRYQILIEPPSPEPPWLAWASTAIEFRDPGEREFVAGLPELVWVVDRFEIELSGPGQNWRKALQLAANSKAEFRSTDSVRLETKGDEVRNYVAKLCLRLGVFQSIDLPGKPDEGPPAPKLLSGPKPERRLRWELRGERPFDLENMRVSDNEQAIVITGGITLLIEGVEGYRMIALQADRMVLWRPSSNTTSPAPGSTTNSGTESLEMYLEGNVVLQWGSDTTRGDQVYYNVDSGRLIVANDLSKPAAGSRTAGTVYDRATKLREQAKFVGEGQRVRPPLKDQVEEIRQQLLRAKASHKTSGTIVNIDNLEKRVYVDRGSDDLLPLGTTFSVWSSARAVNQALGIDDVVIEDGQKPVGRPNPKAFTLLGRASGTKGFLEIVAITGPHLSVARITMDKAFDPITAGDSVFSPIWSPGRPRHFALAGHFDVTGRGANQRDLLVQIITKQGGVVDAELQDDGTLEGDVKVDTDWLVIGSLPDASASDRPQSELAKRMLAEVARLKKTASELGLEVIDQQKLYDLMGLKRKTNPDK